MNSKLRIPLCWKAPLACFLIAIGNTLEAWLGAQLARRFARGKLAFDGAGDMWRFVLLAAVPSTAISATLGVSTLLMNKLVHTDAFVPVWLTWWTGNLISDLILAPFLILWLGKPLPKYSGKRLAEAAALVICVLAVSAVMFGFDYGIHAELYPVTPLGIPLLLWAGFRFHQRGAIGVAAIMAAFAVRGTFIKFGPFWVGGHANDSLLLLQMFMGTITLTALFVAAIVAEREELFQREQAARAEAQRANQAKDRFLAVLSHELRTPLTPVLATAALLEENTDLPPSSLADVRMIRRNVELEARLIDDLLDLSKIANGKMSLNLQGVHVHALLDAVHTMIRGEADAKSLTVRIECNAQCDQVYADTVRLQQVLWNLFKNAVKFTPTGGSVVVRTQNHQDADGQRLTIEVRDTGVGIKPQILPTVFKPFDQGGPETTQRFGGLGLGLAISKAIVEMHGGHIHGHSDGEGRGSIFTLTFQTAPHLAERGDARAPDTDLAPLLGRPIRVLLVEDHEDTLRTLRRLLENAGFRTTGAISVTSAIQVINSETFDVLVSDIGLPDGNGLELLGKIRASGIEIPAIALTGFGMEDDIHQSRLAGFAAHLTKPVDTRQLAGTIRQTVLGTLTPAVSAPVRD